MRTFVAAAALFAAGSAAASAQPGQRCAHDVFPVAGQSIALSTCAAPGGRTVAVTETFKSGGGSFAHTTSIDLLPGAGVARSVDDVGLAPLGLQYTMHLTLAYRDGQISVEHALLLPGAKPLK